MTVEGQFIVFYIEKNLTTMQSVCFYSSSTQCNTERVYKYREDGFGVYLYRMWWGYKSIFFPLFVIVENITDAIVLEGRVVEDVNTNRFNFLQNYICNL